MYKVAAINRTPIPIGGGSSKRLATSECRTAREALAFLNAQTGYEEVECISPEGQALTLSELRERAEAEPPAPRTGSV